MSENLPKNEQKKPGLLERLRAKIGRGAGKTTTEQATKPESIQTPDQLLDSINAETARLRGLSNNLRMDAAAVYRRPLGKRQTAPNGLTELHRTAISSQIDGLKHKVIITALDTIDKDGDQAFDIKGVTVTGVLSGHVDRVVSVGYWQDMRDIDYGMPKESNQPEKDLKYVIAVLERLESDHRRGLGDAAKGT